MPEQSRTWRTWCHSSPGSTLVEVVTALALLTVLSAVGLSAAKAAMQGLTASLEEVRWNTTVLRFDRTVRRAIDGLPPAFWAPSPRLRREGGELSIVDGSEVIRFSLRGGLLSVTTRETKVLFRDITAVSVQEVKGSNGREGGMRIELAAGGHRQGFFVTWEGRRL